MGENVYISFAKCTEIKNEKIRVSDVADVWCQNEKTLAQIKNTVIGNVNNAKDCVYTYTVISVIKQLEKKLPEITVNNLGDSEFLISYHYKKNPSIVWRIIKVIFISLIVFCGGAFAIMAYGNDIDIGKLFNFITDFFIGEEKGDSLVIEVAYSVGLSLGIILFFNNWGKRKQTKDPTPIQVSMRSYEEELYKTIIENNVREGKLGDGN